MQLMKFAGWLEESRAQEMVHHNPSMSTLKSLAKNNRWQTARFTINHEGKMKAGDSFHHVHRDLESDHQTKIRGVVIHHEGKYHYRSYGPFDHKATDHPMLRRLEKSGIENGNDDGHRVEEEFGIQSDYANPKAPQHDLWKHGLPAIKHKMTGHVIIGKRGEAHEDMTDNHVEYHHGIFHKKEKRFYRTGHDTHMDSTDLMTARQRANRFM